MTERDKRCYVLGLSLVPSLSAVLGGFLAAGADPEELYRASRLTLSSRWGMNAALAERIVAERATVRLEREKEKVLAARAWITSVIDDDYPAALRSTPRPPALLYVRGALPDGPAVAVVGSRKATTYGLSAAQKLARELAEAGVTVVSGLALGIDCAAHKAALEAGGATLAVLGCGIDSCYPRRNAFLVPKILESGAIVSELPVGAPPLPHHFPMRNRIISGLSSATVIVEAAANSGSLYTADFALAQGRDVLAVPGSIYSPTSAGTNALLADGAGPARCAEDIFDAIGLEPPERSAARRQEMTEAERNLVQTLAGEPLSAGEITGRCGLPPAQISTLLTLLEIKGVVRRGLDQRFVCVIPASV